MSSEMEDKDLPEGWTWALLGQLIQSSMNGYGKRRQDAGEPAIVLRLADIIDQDVSLESPISVAPSRGYGVVLAGALLSEPETPVIP